MDEQHYNRPNVADVGGAVEFRASSLGNCMIGLAWDLRASRGLDKELAGPVGIPARVQEAMDESSALERQALDLLADRYPHLDLVELQLPFSKLLVNPNDLTGPKARLRGTADAMTGNNLTIVEIKTVGEKLFHELEATRGTPWQDCPPLVKKYRWQVGGYRLLYDRLVQLAVVKKNKGGLTGETFIFTPDAPNPIQIMERMFGVIKLADMGELSCTGGDGLCKWEARHHRPQVQMAVELMELRKLEAEAKDLAFRIKNLRGEIAEEVKANGGKAQVVTTEGTWKLAWVETHVKEKEPREYDRKYLSISGPKLNADG